MGETNFFFPEQLFFPPFITRLATKGRGSRRVTGGFTVHCATVDTAGNYGRDTGAGRVR